jgi:CoA:oxalate CoA-transferase
MSGLMSITGQPGGQPSAVGESFADVATGMFGAFAVVSALFERSRTGKGTHIDVAMFDSLVAMQSTALARLAATNQAPGRVGNRHPVTVPVDSFHARDGLFTLVAPSDGHFRRLAAMIGQPGLAEDPRFTTNAARAKHEPELKKAIEAWTTQYSVDECVAACTRAEIPAGPVWDLRQATTSEHAVARGLLQPVQHPAFGSIAMVQQPARFSTASASTARREPLLGEHTSEVLRELGVSESEIEQLKSESAI